MKKESSIFSKFIPITLIVLIIILGTFFRFFGINWDQDFHLHPDERFLTMVETSISPVSDLREYFDTGASSLNPHNVLDANGNSVFPFFVYGSLPLFIVRYVAEWTGQTGYDQVFLVGRYLSGIFDIGTIILVFFIARILFTKKWLPYLAAFLYACSVLPIQISHFFIVDNFTTFFSTLALFAAVNIWKQTLNEKQAFSSNINTISQFFDFSGFKYFAIFGTAFGMALASKINAAVIVFFLPIAIILNDPGIIKNTSSLKWKKQFHHLIFAGILSFLVFRILQPYAFMGPGFFNIFPNPRWIANLRELAALSSGDSNYPPSLQWARRSFWFPINNLVIWGLGLPAGLFAISGLILMTWKIIIGQWEKFGLIWLFSIGYLAWQTSLWNPTMRYFLLIYPVLVIIAAWFLFQVIETIKKAIDQNYLLIKKIIYIFLSIFLILGTFIWAFSFINIYVEPMTRIAASQWVYENIESAINLTIKDQNGASSQPLPYTHYLTMEQGNPLEISFIIERDGTLNQLSFDHIVSSNISETPVNLSVRLINSSTNEIIYSGTISNSFQKEDDSRGKKYEIILDKPQAVVKGEELKVSLELLDANSSINFFGYLSSSIESENSIYSQPIFEFVKLINENSNYELTFRPFRDGQLTDLNFFRILELDKQTAGANVSIELYENVTGNLLGSWDEAFNLQGQNDFRGSNYQVNLKNPVQLISNVPYSLKISVFGGESLALNGSKSAKETDWDDALPLYMYGLNPFDLYQGIYPSDLNFQMYWDDNQEKLSRFVDDLARADTIIFSSNRQWGSTTQIPERYPLTTLFYKELLGCTSEDVQWCYRVAYPGLFKGSLGFELVKTFQVNPSYYSIEFNSQFAEEAFTVYDHPKVFIFKKSEDFNPNSVIEKLSAVNLSQVLNLSPKEADQRPGSLLLSQEQVNRQKTSGTWSDLLNYSSIQNKYPIASICIWYLFITVLGWMFYPLTRIVFKGLPDRGYPLLKITALLSVSFLSWVVSSTLFDFSRLLILVMILLVFIINFYLFLMNKSQIINEVKQNYRYFIKVELIGLLFFTFFLLIRLGNPDLWHPYKGGEKPMDFSYFNAVIKSIRFPPYDPWYSGGYINYYYFGFVIAAIPVKVLEIIPSIAYNLILPTFFCFTALGAFSLGWNFQNNQEFTKTANRKQNNNLLNKLVNNPFSLAIISALFILIIGNLGTIRMIIQGIFKLGLNNLPFKSGNIFQVLLIYINGIKQYMGGARFNYYPGDWYWIPSRTIPGEAITEFPFFTFLYGDPHAHLFAYPITLLALAWSFSVILGKWIFSEKKEIFIQFLFGALIIGSLRATNTWDYPTYLGIAICAITYGGFKYLNSPKYIFGNISPNLKKIFLVLFLNIAFVALTIILYYPFIRWFGQGYSSIEIWNGDKTPIGSYLIHWGLFLFIIYSWVILEIYQWMASTPLSALRPFYPYRKHIGISILLLLILLGIGFFWGVQILIIAFPILISLILLIFRKKYSDSKRFALFLVIIGLTLTLVVEIVVLKGDIGRMNTVFKFYLQAWTLLALGSAILLYRFIKSIRITTTHEQLKKIWITLLALFLTSVFLFTITGSVDKITDRISKDTPMTLDGMTYMRYSSYFENDVLMNLNQDYEAIKWVQENIKGTPTIVEANVPEYLWGNRYTIYTGLPGVIGWNWHQRQQRSINPSDWVTSRIEDISKFYSLPDLNYSKEFLNKYNVDFVIVGQLEKAVYPAIGIEKFDNQNNSLWTAVYRSEDTVIYKVKKND